MNLARFDTRTISEEGQWVDILDWDWETKIGFRVKILGPDSSVAAKIADDEEKQFQAKMASVYAHGKKDVLEDDELSVDKAIAKAVKITIAWESGEWEGKELPFNEENAKMLYTQCPHIRTQILSQYAARINFTKAESSNSEPSSDSVSRSTTRVKRAH